MPTYTRRQHPFSDAYEVAHDDLDPTKKIIYQLSAITTGTTRTITFPDNDVDLTLVGGAGSFVSRAGDTMSGLLQFSGTTHTGLRLLSLTTAERNALTPIAGDLLYNETTTKLQGYEGSAYVDLFTAGGGSAVSTERDVNQVAHGLAVEDVIRDNGTIYVKAQADTAANVDGIIGVVTAVAGVDDFTYTSDGFTALLPGVAQGTSFVSAGTAGLLTITEPNLPGQVSVPVLYSRSSSESHINIQRGVVLP